MPPDFRKEVGMTNFNHLTDDGISGLMFCADCGGKLYVYRVYNSKDKPTAVCGNYAKAYDKVSVATIKCKSGHSIDAATLMELIRDTIKAIADYAKTDKAGFVKSVQETLAAQQTNEVKNQRKRLAVCKKRAAELETLLRKIYEDYALGKLPDKRYEAMSSDYGKEQDALEIEIAELQSSVERYENGNGRAKHFISLVERYTDFTEITVTMLNEFIEKIVVHERDRKGAIDSPQTVEIHLNFIGEYIPPMMGQKKLTAKEKAEQIAVLERRQRFRRAYEQRVASGAQKQYYERTKHKKRAQYDAEKAVILDESYTLGANAALPMAVNQ